MTQVHNVKKAQKDYPEQGIKKGEEYFWWSFRFGGKHLSKTPPKPSQLTQSEYLQGIYEIQETIESLEAEDAEDLKSRIDEIIEQLGEIRDTCQGNLDNMPEQLQEGDTGQLLQERIETVEGAIEELEGIDVDDDVDEDDVIHEIDFTDMSEETRTSTIKAMIEQKKIEKINEAIEEIKQVSLDG